MLSPRAPIVTHAWGCVSGRSSRARFDHAVERARLRARHGAARSPGRQPVRADSFVWGVSRLAEGLSADPPGPENIQHLRKIIPKFCINLHLRTIATGVDIREKLAGGSHEPVTVGYRSSDQNQARRNPMDSRVSRCWAGSRLGAIPHASIEAATSCQPLAVSLGENR